MYRACTEISSAVVCVLSQLITRVVGALTEITKVAENREIFYTNGGIQMLLSYQKVTNAKLLVNVNNAIANCALHRPSLR